MLITTNCTLLFYQSLIEIIRNHLQLSFYLENKAVVEYCVDAGLKPTKQNKPDTQVVHLRVNSFTNVSIGLEQEMLNIQSSHGLYSC